MEAWKRVASVGATTINTNAGGCFCLVACEKAVNSNSIRVLHQPTACACVSCVYMWCVWK